MKKTKHCSTGGRGSFGFAVVIAIGLAGVLLGARNLPADDREVHPNILLVLTDDQGFGDLGLHGNPWIDTPEMDQLAAEGTRLNRFLVSPVCAPTRASLLTGRYAGRAGVTGVSRGREVMRTEEITLAEMLRKAGYATGVFGKWHNGENHPFTPGAQGFDEFFGFCAGGVYQYFDAEYQHNLDYVRVPGYIADVLTDKAIDFLRQNQSRPSFCYVAYNTPHSPWQVPDRFFDKYKALGLADEVAAVYGMVENIDENLGRLLATLDETGMAENTIVIFMSDNGPVGADNGTLGPGRFDAGMKGRKGGPDEGSMRVPCFFRWPNHIAAGRVVEDIAAHIDILPTLAELCSVELPAAKLDGRSLAPVLLGRSATGMSGRTLFARNAVRTDRWRLTLSADQVALYDMLADPGQHRDVGAVKPAVKWRLESEYRKWAKETGLDREFTVPPAIQTGFVEAPSTYLPTPYAEKVLAHMNTPYSQGYLERWNSLEGFLEWPVTVMQSGEFEVRLWYVCSPEALGTRLQVEFQDAKAELEITKARDPSPIPVPERVPQTLGNIKRWMPVSMGKVSLTKGPQKVRLRPIHLSGLPANVEVKRVELVYLP